ncbi:MAG: hypothetical protein JST67_10180 [Bacteroidetes bacterium]|nr:hypothetical protein [Bacteroidota bacterium]
MLGSGTKITHSENAKRRIERLKQVHYLVAIVLFVGTFFFCSTYDTNFHLTTMSLSHLGIYKKIGFVWNISLFIIGITLMIESFLNMNKYMPGSKLLYLFVASIVCLLLTASITMDHPIHYYFAFSYFIGYTVGIFLFGLLLMKTDFRIGFISVVIAISTLVLPMWVLMWLHSYAIPELIHTALIFVWVSVTKFDAPYKNFIKRFGL